MGRGPAKFTQSDVARAIRAAKREGAPAVEIKPDGTILVSLSPTHTDAEEKPPKPEREIVL